MTKANVTPNVTTKCYDHTRYGDYYMFTVVPTTVKTDQTLFDQWNVIIL